MPRTPVRLSPCLMALASAALAAQAAPTAACSVTIAGEVRPASLEAGRRSFLKCRACHMLAEGERHLVGPNLWQLFRRPAGSAPGFAYSAAITPDLGPWTNDSLDRFLAQPSRAVPGNRMVFAGLPNPAERASLIAYLREATGDPEPNCSR